MWWQGDLLETQWRCGRERDARQLVAQLVADAERTGSTWAAAIAVRGRGLLAADTSALLESARLLELMDAPFEAARSAALIGEIAEVELHRPVLEQALGAFESLGAGPWARRTSELLGVPYRADQEGGAVAAARSKAELRVALAIARGMSNRAAADSLYLSPKTIDSHLQRIYRKLGVRSRTELALLTNRGIEPKL